MRPTRGSALRRLELQTSDDRAIARQLDRGHRTSRAEGRVDSPKAGRSLPSGRQAWATCASLRCLRISESRILHACAIEDVAELRPDVDRRSLLDPERTAYRQVFYRPPLEAIVAIIGSRRTPLPCGRLGP